MKKDINKWIKESWKGHMDGKIIFTVYIVLFGLLRTFYGWGFQAKSVQTGHPAFQNGRYPSIVIPAKAGIQR